MSDQRPADPGFVEALGGLMEHVEDLHTHAVHVGVIRDAGNLDALAAEILAAREAATEVLTDLFIAWRKLPAAVRARSKA